MKTPEEWAAEALKGWRAPHICPACWEVHGPRIMAEARREVLEEAIAVCAEVAKRGSFNINSAEVRCSGDYRWGANLVADRLHQRRSGVVERIYVHRSLRPLEEVDLSTPEDRGQVNLFIEECEGMCGV